MNWSYTTLADIYYVANEEKNDKLIKFGRELEAVGVATYEDVEYMYRDTAYGKEVVSMEDYYNEQPKDLLEKAENGTSGLTLEEQIAEEL